MTRTKNETCFDSLKEMVAQSSPDSNILGTLGATYMLQSNVHATHTQQTGLLSVTHLQQIKRASYLQYDFSPSGVISIILPDSTALSFDTNSMRHDLAETLVVACLQDKTVIGYDLYTSYTLSFCLTEEWQPSCTLNIPTLRRVFRCANPLVEGLHALPQLMSMTGTNTFGAAMERLFDWDEACDGSFFRVCELLPQAMAPICTEAIQGMAFDGSNRLTFEGSLKTDFVERKASLMTSTKSSLLEFDLYFLTPVHQEFQLAVNSVSNSLSAAWKMM